MRYWRPAHYIALSPSKGAGSTACDGKLIVLPDKSEEYAITMNAGIGTAEADPTLQDGWNLTTLTGKADSKTAETITAFASLLKAAAPSGLADQPLGPSKPWGREMPFKCSGLLQLVFDKASGDLVGFRHIEVPTAFSLDPPSQPESAQSGSASTAGKPKQK